MIYTVPSLTAVDFALTAHTPADLTPATQALAVYAVPSLTSVDFALTTWAPPTYPDVGWELLPSGGPSVTQYAGFRFYDGSSVVSLSLVDPADAPAGPQLRIRKSGTNYAIWLVDTTDPNASPIRFRLASGTKAARLLT